MCFYSIYVSVVVVIVIESSILKHSRILNSSRTGASIATLDLTTVLYLFILHCIPTYCLDQSKIPENHCP